MFNLSLRIIIDYAIGWSEKTTFQIIKMLIKYRSRESKGVLDA